MPRKRARSSLNANENLPDFAFGSDPKKRIEKGLDELLEENRMTELTLLTLAVIGSATAILAPFLSESHNKYKIAGISAFVGIVTGLTWLFSVKRKPFQKRVKYFKKVINEDPQQIFWVYMQSEMTETGRHAKVIINFKNGTTFSVKTAAHHLMDNPIVRDIQKLNPAVHLGYSEEVERLWNKLY